MLPMLRRKGVCIGSIFYAVILLFRLFKNTRPLSICSAAYFSKTLH